MNGCNTKSFPCAKNFTNVVSSPHLLLLGIFIRWILLSQLFPIVPRFHMVVFCIHCHRSSREVGPGPKPELCSAGWIPPSNECAGFRVHSLWPPQSPGYGFCLASAHCITVVVSPWWASMPFYLILPPCDTCWDSPRLTVEKMKGDLEMYAL